MDTAQPRYPHTHALDRKHGSSSTSKQPPRMDPPLMQWTWERLLHLCWQRVGPALDHLDRLESAAAVRLTQWFPVVLHFAWLRHVLVCVCMPQLAEQCERDVKHLEASVAAVPKYDVSEDVLYRLRLSFAFALGRHARPSVTNGLPNLGHVLLEAPPGAAVVQEQVVASLAHEFGMRLVVFESSRSHLCRWLRRQFGDGRGATASVVSSVLSFFAPAALEALMLDAAFTIASSRAPCVLLIEDAGTLVRTPEVWAHLERQLRHLHAQRLPVAVVAASTTDKSGRGGGVSGMHSAVAMLGRGATRTGAGRFDGLLGGADDTFAAFTLSADVDTEGDQDTDDSDANASTGVDGQPVAPADVHTSTARSPRASASGALAPATLSAGAGPKGMRSGGHKAFATLISLEPPEGVKRSAWLAQIRRDERASRSDASLATLSRLCDHLGLPVDFARLERDVGLELISARRAVLTGSMGDGPGRSLERALRRAAHGPIVESEEEMTHVLAWAVGDYFLNGEGQGLQGACFRGLCGMGASAGGGEASSKEGLELAAMNAGKLESVPAVAGSAPLKVGDGADAAVGDGVGDLPHSPLSGCPAAAPEVAAEAAPAQWTAGESARDKALLPGCRPRAVQMSASDALVASKGCATEVSAELASVQPSGRGRSCPPAQLVLDPRHLSAAVRLAKTGAPPQRRPAPRVRTSNRFEESLLACVVPAQEIGVTWDDIATLDDAKQALREVVSLPLLRPELFCRGNLTAPTRGVLLFGPPGTGKTLLAKAVASDAMANFMQVTLSTVMSKWLGESNKFIRALFSLCSKLAPAVLFIDEVDAMLQTRGKAEEQAAVREMKNEFMLHWDGLRTREWEQVVVLAATNRPFDLDDAVLRRMPRRILIPLPDRAAREQILSLLLHEEALEDGFSIDHLAGKTEGYSGSDLKALCVRAAHEPIRELLREEDSARQTDPADGQGTPGHRGASMPAAMLRPIRMTDFFRHGGAELVISASVSRQSASVEELYRWNDTYGESARRSAPQLSYYT